MRVLVLLSLGILFAQCQRSIPVNDVDSSKNGDYYIQDPKLETVYDEASQLEFIRSMIIWKNDQIISEGYFQTYRNDSLDHVRSVTKSIISLLTGIALDQGLIEDVYDPIEKYLGNKLAKYSGEKLNITIKDLLTMSAGFKWDEMSDVNEFNRWVVSADPVDYLFRRQFVDDPGTNFNYNSALPHILSRVITDVSGQSTFDFAMDHLFSKLDIDNVRWQKTRDGYYNGGAGLEIKPSDLLKIGIMVLKNGSYNGQRVVSEEWMVTTFQDHLPVDPKDLNYTYGYLWWINHIDTLDIYSARGFGGQYLGVLPEQEMVYVVTSQWTNLEGRSEAYLKELDKLFVRNIDVLLSSGID